MARVTLTARREVVLAAARSAVKAIPPMRNGEVSPVVGKAPLDSDPVVAVSAGRYVSAYMIFARGNPGAWQLWTDVCEPSGRVVVSGRGMHDLARRYVDHLDRVAREHVTADAEGR